MFEAVRLTTNICGSDSGPSGEARDSIPLSLRFPSTRTRARGEGSISLRHSSCRIHESFALKVDDVGMNRRGVVQQVVILAFEVFVEERERAGSDRPALLPGNGGRINR